MIDWFCGPCVVAWKGGTLTSRCWSCGDMGHKGTLPNPTRARYVVGGA